MSIGGQFVIWGSAGHAKVLAEIVFQQGGTVAAVFDNDPQATPISADIPLYIGEQGLTARVVQACKDLGAYDKFQLTS